MKSTIFEPQSIPEKDVSRISHNRYRVYSDADHFVTVEADNAKAALEKSGIKKALRIDRDVLNYYNVVEIEKLIGQLPPPEEPHMVEYVESPAEPDVAPETPQAATAEKAPEPPLPEKPEVAVAEEKPLSSEDIDSLLKG